MKKLKVIINITAIVYLFASPLLALDPDETAERRKIPRSAQAASASANTGQRRTISGTKSKGKKAKRPRSDEEASSAASNGTALVTHPAAAAAASSHANADREDELSLTVIPPSAAAAAAAACNSGDSGAAGSGSNDEGDAQAQRSAKRARTGASQFPDEDGSFSVTVGAPAAAAAAHNGEDGETVGFSAGTVAQPWTMGPASAAAAAFSIGAAGSGSDDGRDQLWTRVPASAAAAACSSGAADSSSGSREDAQLQRLAKRVRTGISSSPGEAAAFSVTVAAPAASSSAAAAAAALPVEIAQQQHIIQLKHAFVHNLLYFPPGLKALTLSYLIAGPNYKSLISKIQAGLEEFDISHNILGDDFAKEWATDPALLQESYLLRGVQTLLLNDNFFGDDGLESLRRTMKVLFSLRWLNASNNHFTKFSVLDVARDLEHMDLSGNRITDAGMRHLFKQGPRGKLVTLCLHGNSYGDQGVNWLFWDSAGWQVRHLSVEGKKLTPKGITVLERRLPKSVQFLVITGVKNDVINQLNTVFRANQRNVRVANMFSAETMGLPSLLPTPKTPRLDSILQSVSHGERLDIGAAAAGPASGHRKQTRSLMLMPPLASE